MEKRYGATRRNDCLMQIGRSKWELIYGYDTDGVSGWTYRERFSRKPTLDEIKAIIIAQINSNTEEKILSGFTWNDTPIWLSSENQYNYKAAYDLAVQNGESSLPVKFKFGTDENPVYHTFDNLEELSSFYTSAVAYIQQTLAAGWDEKDNVDWTKFTL